MSKEIYLTIDDSPSADMQAKVDFLYKKNIPAVWFCIGKFIRQRPKSVIDAIRKGFIIGNHSFSHPHFSDLTIEQAYLEIQTTDLWIEQLYEQAGVKRLHKFFRFPYGDKGDLRRGKVFEPLSEKGKIRKEIMQAILLKSGYSQPDFPKVTYEYMHQAGLMQEIDWHWTFDIMDWATFEKKPTFGLKNLTDILNRLEEMNPKDCRGEIKTQEPRGLNAGNSAEIILLHDHEPTTLLFEPILEKLLAKGVKFLDCLSLDS